MSSDHDNKIFLPLKEQNRMLSLFQKE